MSKALSMLIFPGVLISGILGQKVAKILWSRVLGSAPPDTGQEDVRWPQLIPAAMVEGTVYQLSRMLFDRGVRRAIATATGAWPGEPGQGQ